MPIRAKFLTDKSTRERLEQYKQDANTGHWYFVVCMNGKHHKGKDFDAFVNLVNANLSQVNQVTIITSCWLERHYVGETKANVLGQEWYAKHQQAIEKIQVKNNFFTWREFFSDEEAYRNANEKTIQLYQDDNTFETIINNSTRQNRHYGGDEAARNYALEDAASAILLKGYFPYPGKSLNPALSYTANLYNPDLHILGYRLDEVTLSPKKSTLPASNQNETEKINKRNLPDDADSPLFEEVASTLVNADEKQVKLVHYCVKVADTLNRLGIFSKQEQIATFSDILNVIGQHIPQNGVSTDEERKLTLKVN